MAKKKAAEGGEAGTSKRLRTTRLGEPEIVEEATDFDDMETNDEVESLHGDPESSEEESGTRLQDVQNEHARGDADVNFRIKMLEFMDNVNQELKRTQEKSARQEKLIEHLLMQGSKPSSSTKKLAKVNMPSTFSGLVRPGRSKNFSWKWTTIMMSKSPRRMTRSRSR